MLNVKWEMEMEMEEYEEQMWIERYDMKCEA